jgi:hypothetical protein
MTTMTPLNEAAHIIGTLIGAINSHPLTEECDRCQGYVKQAREWVQRREAGIERPPHICVNGWRHTVLRNHTTGATTCNICQADLVLHDDEYVTVASVHESETVTDGQ